MKSLTVALIVSKDRETIATQFAHNLENANPMCLGGGTKGQISLVNAATNLLSINAFSLLTAIRITEGELRNKNRALVYK